MHEKYHSVRSSGSFVEVYFPSAGRMMKFLVAILVVVLLSYVFPSLIVASPPPKVLVLNSYHPGYRWSDEIIAGIRQTLLKEKQDAVIFVEYMDSKRIESQATSQRLAELIKEKYSTLSFDIVIVSDNNALSFLRQYRQDLFPNIPAILCGANDLQQSDIEGLAPITGINEAADISDTIAIALKLLPSTRHIFVVSDTTVTGKNVSREIKRSAAAFTDRVDFTYWDNVDMEGLVTNLKNLPKDSIVLFSFFFRDSNGRFYEYNDSATRITEASSSPVFGLWEFNLGFGIVGGKLVSGFEQGRIAGTMVLRLLNGEDISAIPLQLQSPNRYGFDFKVLQKYDIDRSLLPPESRIINTELSIYEKHKAILWSIFVAFIALTTLTIFLLLSIKKQRKVEEKLRHSEQRMAEIIDFLPDPTFVIDSHGKILAWNRAIEDLTNVKSTFILGKGDYEYALPFYAERRPVMIDLVSTWNDEISKHYRDIKKVGQLLISETQEPNPLLGNRIFRTVCGPLYDQDGNVAGAIETLHDITHRRKAEQETEKLVIETQKNLAFIQAMMSAIPSPVYFKDTSFRFLGCNQAYAEMQGFTDEEIKGKTVYDLYPKDKADIYNQKDIELLQNPGRQEYETEVVDRYGKSREVFFAKDVFRDHHGKVAGIVGSFMDISDLKNAEKEKEKLEAQLRQSQKLEALGTLAGGVAHDFNNILSAVLGYSELGMKEVHESQQSFFTKFQAIHRAGIRAKELVDQILAFSRMQEQLHAPVRVATLVNEVAALLKSSLPTDIQLSVQCTTEKSVLGDPTQLHQIIMNLCTNAYHAMQSSGGRLSVRLDEVTLDASAGPIEFKIPPGQYLCLTVSDTGTGISPAILDRIFDPYFTTKEKNKGTGLGLAVVHGMVKRHHGEIVVNSQVDAGTQFHVYLPISDEKSEEKAAGEMTLPRGCERVLMVDDEKELILIGEEMLRHLGYTVNGIVGSLAGLEAFKKDPLNYDVVISDYDMPGMKGDLLAREILGIRPDIPIILCTGFTERLSEEQAKAIGIRKFLMKPMSMKDMSKGIREVLAQA